MGINLIDKIVPKNNGFLGMVDANQVIGTSGGVYASYLPSSCISGNSILEYYLKISNTPTDGYYLQYKDDTDRLTWAEVVGGSDVAWSGAYQFYSVSSNTKQDILNLYNTSSAFDTRLDNLEDNDEFVHTSYITSANSISRFADSSNIRFRFPGSSNVYNKTWIDTLSGSIDTRMDALEASSFDHTEYIVSSNAISRFANSSNYSSHKGDTTIHFTLASILDDFAGSSNINRSLLDSISGNLDSRLDSIFGYSSNAKNLYADSGNIRYRFVASSLSLNRYNQYVGHSGNTYSHVTTGLSSNIYASIKHSANSTLHSFNVINYMTSANAIDRFYPSTLGHYYTGSGTKLHGAYLSANKVLDTFNHTFYVQSGTKWTDLTDAGETALHIHDARYYTETESLANFAGSSNVKERFPGSSNVNRALLNSISSNLDTRIDSLFNYSSNAKNLYSDSGNVRFRFLASTSSFVTNWTDLTDGGETTLHSHAGASGGPNYWSSQTNKLSDSIYYGAGAVVIGPSGTNYENSRLQVSGETFLSGQVTFIGQLSGVALPLYPSSAINRTYVLTISSNALSHYADSSNIRFRFPGSSSALTKYLASSSFKRNSWDSDLWHNSSLVWDKNISAWKPKKSGSTGVGTPGGDDTQIQFNDGGSFGGDAQLTWDKTTNTITLAGAISAQSISGQIRSLSNSLEISNWNSSLWHNSSLSWDSTLNKWKAKKSGAAAGGGTPGGSNSQIQYNDGGSFGGSGRLTFDDVTGLTSISGQVNISGNIFALRSGLTIGNNQKTACINLNINDSGRYSSQLMLFRNDGYEGEYLGCLAVKEPNKPLIYYGGGYSPQFLVNRTQETPYAGCTAFQAWIQAKKQNPSELYSFWGGVYDTGSDAVDIDSQAIGIMCYNMFAGTNERTIERIEGGHFTSELNSSITSTYIVGGHFAATEGVGSPTVTNTIGVEITDTGGAAATNDYGIKIARIYKGTSKNYAIHTAGGEVALARDNAKLIFGTGLDATIYYNGTNLFINSKEVGTGVTYISSTAMTNILKLQPVKRSNPSPVIGQVWASGTTTKCGGIYYCTGTKWLKMT